MVLILSNGIIWEYEVLFSIIFDFKDFIYKLSVNNFVIVSLLILYINYYIKVGCFFCDVEYFKSIKFFIFFFFGDIW